MLDISTMSDDKTPLKRAIEAAGGPAALGKEVGVSAQAVCQWDEVPPLRVLAVERASGISRHELRPDLYPPAEPAKAVEAARA